MAYRKDCNLKKHGALTNCILQKALLQDGLFSVCNDKECSAHKYVNNVDIFPSNTLCILYISKL